MEPPFLSRTSLGCCVRYTSQAVIVYPVAYWRDTPLCSISIDGGGTGSRRGTGSKRQRPRCNTRGDSFPAEMIARPCGAPLPGPMLACLDCYKEAPCTTRRGSDIGDFSFSFLCFLRRHAAALEEGIGGEDGTGHRILECCFGWFAEKGVYCSFVRRSLACREKATPGFTAERGDKQRAVTHN